MNIRRIIEKTVLIAICLTIGLYTTLFAKKEIRVGVLYDYTGPLAGAGGVPGGDGRSARKEGWAKLWSAWCTETGVLCR